MSGWPFRREKVLVRQETRHNLIEVVEQVDGTRTMRLDHKPNLHSVWIPGQFETGSYWDDFGLLSPIVPAGPLAVLGLGGGTVVRLYRHFWPERRIVAWEWDEQVVAAGRAFMGLADEEAVTIHIGDAFGEKAMAVGGFGAMVIDLFVDGDIHPRLTTPPFWRSVKARLIEGGRAMVNLSGRHDTCLEVLMAMRIVFGDDLSSKRAKEAWNLLFMTGPPPDPATWEASLPHPLRPRIEGWEPAPRPSPP